MTFLRATILLLLCLFVFHFSYAQETECGSIMLNPNERELRKTDNHLKILYKVFSIKVNPEIDSVLCDAYQFYDGKESEVLLQLRTGTSWYLDELRPPKPQSSILKLFMKKYRNTDEMYDWFSYLALVSAESREERYQIIDKLCIITEFYDASEKKVLEIDTIWATSPNGEYFQPVEHEFTFFNETARQLLSFNIE